MDDLLSGECSEGSALIQRLIFVTFSLQRTPPSGLCCFLEVTPTTAEMEEKPQTQYQHYIPQFLLRRFAIPLLAGSGNGKNRINNQKRKAMLNVVSLDKDPPEIGTRLARKILGQEDMYKDDSMFSKKEQMRIETKLGVIEQAASRIIAKVADAHEAGENEISLSRYDKDVLRKFLFVMKYRGVNFFDRFNHKTAEEYDSNDRDAFLDYMRAKGFKRPLDVWFDNLTKIIDMPMDPAGEWTQDLFDIIYPGDAVWLFTNIRTMYLAFVTPSDLSEEFILTENSFGIHEGPVSCSVDRLTGKQKTTAYTEFHVLSVISPHLAMVLRHNLLPEPLEDKDIKVRDGKKEQLAMNAQFHYDPDHATSLLQDLPVAKPRNSYTVVRNGRLELARGADGVPRAADTFRFRFFRLESIHVQTINAVMLDQAHEISTLVFKSKTALRRALEFYLSFPTQAKGGHSLKTISERQDDPMLLLFRKLEHLAHTLGSDVKAKYHIDPLVDTDEPAPLDEIIAEVLKTAKPTTSNTLVDMVTTVLLQVLIKSNSNVLSIYAIDLITQADGRPSYPKSVFEAVQLSDPANLNQHTKELFAVELQTWILVWEMLAHRASQVPGAGLDHYIKLMREQLAQIGIVPCSDPLPAPAWISAQNASQFEQQYFASQLCSPSQKNMGVKAATKVPEFSRQGLSKAFDNIGRNIQEQDVSLRGNSELVKLDASARQIDSERDFQRGQIHSSQQRSKEYFKHNLSTVPVGVRDVSDESSFRSGVALLFFDVLYRGLFYLFVFTVLVWPVLLNLTRFWSSVLLAFTLFRWFIFLAFTPFRWVFLIAFTLFRWFVLLAWALLRWFGLLA